MTHRRQMWERLGAKTADILIVGGGINGAGIARDAARRGLDVAVVEKNGIGSGTSSRSSKLVHGGLRYLEQFEFSLVFESVSERRILMDIAPHMVNPLPFLFPVYKGSRRKLTTVKGGMWLYEGLSLFRSPKRHRTLKKKDVLEQEPALLSKGLKGAPVYYDCSTDDARLTLESALDAVQVGGIVCPWAEVTGFLRDDSGRVVGAQVRDAISGEVKDVRANVVINATGPWTDRTIAMSTELDSSLLRPTKGVHIVVEREKLPVQHAVVIFHPGDGRVLFAIPWEDKAYLGTTDTDHDGEPGNVHATLSDVDYLIEASNAYFPDHPIGRDDVISTWAGLRPLMAPAQSADAQINESSVSREHQVIVGQDGLITIAGGKLTTYRKMSEEVVETAINYLRLTNHLPASLSAAKTATEPLPGAVGWPADDNHERVAEKVRGVAGDLMSMETARLLANTYGMLSMKMAAMIRDTPELGRLLHPDRPEVVAQVVYAVEHELAVTVTDVMVQRTQIFYRAADQGLGITTDVATIMGDILEWDEAMRTRMSEEYQKEVADSRQWRDEVE